MIAQDPWALDRPTILSVSGGRTSMHMLWRYLDRYDGKLPASCVPVFCNTGKEHPKTLDFVQRCSTEWNVPIVWVEYIDAELPRDRYQVVSHNAASRDGAPYEAMIRSRSMLPNTMARTCTIDLKVTLTHRWARGEWDHGQGRYTKAIGFRADEGHRVARAKARCGKSKDAWDVCWPLFDAGVCKPEILRWWGQQAFDLDIPARLGNCDLCFLKARHKLAQNIAEAPERADWWVEQESKKGETFRSRTRPLASYADLRAYALTPSPKPWDQIELGGLDAADLECACTD